MSTHSQDSGGGSYDSPNDKYYSGCAGADRNSFDKNSGRNRNYSDHNLRREGGEGYGSGGNTGGYSHGQHDNAESGKGNYNGSRNDYRSNNSDPNRDRSKYNNNNDSNGGDDARIETQHDTIFIQNLPRNVTAPELHDVFSQIGKIKNDKKTNASKIWIYKDKSTGEGKGEATITYEDEEAAQAAINWFNGKEVLSNIVQISLATRRTFTAGSRGGFRGRGGFFGRGGAGGYRSCGGDRSGGGIEYRSIGRGASHSSSRDHRPNPY